MEGFSMASSMKLLDQLLEWQPPDFVKAGIKYKSTSYVQIDYPFIGALNRGLQIGILAFTLWQIFSEKTWAYYETPLGTVNAFGGPGEASKTYTQAAAKISALPYCDNASHIFTYSANFDYGQPECQYVVPEQLVVKGTQQVQFITMFLERRFKGYPCGTDTCSSPSVEIKHESNQCVCKTTKTVYPVGVEGMKMSFEHTYEFPVSKFEIRDWKGSSTLNKALADKIAEITAHLDTYVVGPTGEQKMKEGASVSLTLSDWLQAAGATFDEVNELGGADASDRKGADGTSARLPYNRMTGMVINVLIDYRNGQPSVTPEKRIYAKIKAEKQLIGWAGPGSERVHITYPTGPLGAQNFEYVDRYSQGVVFNFNPTGQVYYFDWQYMLNVIITALVLLGVASTITDTVAFYCLPNGHSAVLAAHRQVVVNRRQGFAELGMRTAIAAKHFQEAFDPDHNEIIEAEDIVRVLAGVAGPSVTYKKKDEDGNVVNVPMDCEKAHAIAIAVLQDQHAGGHEEATPGSFTFSDYMRTQDNGTIPFPDFLAKVALPEEGAFVPTEADKRRVQKAWEDGLRSEGAKKKEKTLRRGNSRKNNTSTKDAFLDVTIESSQ